MVWYVYATIYNWIVYSHHRVAQGIRFLVILSAQQSIESYFFKKRLKLTIKFFIYCYYIVWAELWYFLVLIILDLPICASLYYSLVQFIENIAASILINLQLLIFYTIRVGRIYNDWLEFNRWFRIWKGLAGWILVYSYLVY